MSGFEKLVRPAQLGDFSPALLPGPGTVGLDISADKTITLTLGLDGNAKVMFGSETIDQTYYAIRKMRERPR